MNIFSYDNREEAKKYIGYPCLFSDTPLALEQMNIQYVVPGLLRNVVDSDLPFVYYEAPHTYKVDDLACWMDIKQILAAAIYLKYKVEVKNV